MIETEKSFEHPLDVPTFYDVFPMESPTNL